MKFTYTAEAVPILLLYADIEGDRPQIIAFHCRYPFCKPNGQIMLPNFDITLNIYIFLLSLLAPLLLGYAARSRQLAKKARRISELERETLEAHAEVLDTQREYCELESRVKDITNPVIAMKNNKLDESQPTPVPEREGIRKNRPTGTD
jgi:hypothetical protein